MKSPEKSHKFESSFSTDFAAEKMFCMKTSIPIRLAIATFVTGIVKSLGPVKRIKCRYLSMSFVKIKRQKTGHSITCSHTWYVDISKWVYLVRHWICIWIFWAFFIIISLSKNYDFSWQQVFYTLCGHGKSDNTKKYPRSRNFMFFSARPIFIL